MTTSGTDSRLTDGSRIAVIGAGPAGSLFSYFFLDMAGRIGLKVELDLYDPKLFSDRGPSGCNMCGGIISETLVQTLAAEGINLPPGVVQRGIDAYMLHMDVGDIRIDTPVNEKRIAAVHRGGGPRKEPAASRPSFDGFLHSLAVANGARFINQAVTAVDREGERPIVRTKSGDRGIYDLVVIATGVNAVSGKIFDDVLPEYRPPGVTKTAIREFFLGEETVSSRFGDAMHLFLMKIPRLEFAAMIPKGDCVTLCMLGEEIDRQLLDTFLNSPGVKKQLPGESLNACACVPRMSLSPAGKPFGERVVYIGDCSVSRLYKDGIGAAYRTSKAAAKTAVFQGVSSQDFERHYLPACRAISNDNRFGHVIFFVTRQIQRRAFAQRAVLRMVREEQRENRPMRMSSILWDTFTGSAAYRDILMRTLTPAFILTLTRHLFAAILRRNDTQKHTIIPESR